MRNNRLTTKTTDDRLNRPNYDSIPFKNKDIDVLGRMSDIDMSQPPRSKKADRLAKKLANPNTSLDKWKKVMIKYNKETE
jgi:hypothetical protein